MMPVNDGMATAALITIMLWCVWTAISLKR
jgi:hypothetical protein